MEFLIYGLAVLYCVLGVNGSLASRYSMTKQREGMERLVTLNNGKQPSRAVPNNYLNNKTKPYWVDGAALPEVDFNIGESYAGNLPIDDTGKSMFFWFVPSENKAADNEILLWLNGGPGCSSLDG
jgi:carboxypeptidase C (cathepsin A)